MMLAQWRAEMNHAQGERVFLDALKDYASGQLRRRQASHVLATLISIAVLVTPVLVAVVGIIVIIAALPSLVGFIFGSLFFAAGIFLLPARYRIPANSLTCADTPELFGALDEVCAVMGAPRIERVVISDDFNAFVVKAGGQCILGIGALLWQAATPAERQALIAHELAHLVNDDPARGKLIGWALQTLSKWDALLAPDPHHSGNVIGEIGVIPLRVVVEALERTTLRLLYLQSQRAEYLADALAVRAAGPAAVTQLLQKTSLFGYVQGQWSALHGVGDARGREVLELLVSPVAKLKDAERDDLLNALNFEALTVDGTHPPTGYRLGFIRALPVAAPKLRADLFAKDDPGFSDRLAETGEKLAAVFEVQ